MQEELGVQVEAALRSRNAADFCAAISSTLTSNRAAFPVLRSQLQQLLAADEAQTSGEFVLACIEEGMRSEQVSPAICHLILDTAKDLYQWPPQQAEGSSCTTRRHAAAVLLQCCRKQPRLAAKVALAFRLALDDLAVQQQVELLDHISALLDANSSSASGVSLLLQFRPLLRHFHLEAVLEDLVLSSQEPVAAHLVRELGSREIQVQLVGYCLQYGQLRSADNMVKEFGLQQEFPDVERMHKSKQLGKMIEKGLWGVAGQYVGDNGELQRTLIAALLVAGELSLAQQHQQLFGLQGEFEIHPEQLAAEQARRREQYLQMPLPPEALHFVDTAEGLRYMGQRLEALLHVPARHGGMHSPLGAADSAAAAGVVVAATGGQQQEQEEQAAGTAGVDGHLGSAGSWVRDPELLPVLGVDLEWQTDSESSLPPSLLQISTDNEVFMVDLLALGVQGEALAAALAPVLASDRVFKLGCGIVSDFKKLAGHHPAAFSLARSCLDLSVLWRFHHIEQPGKRFTACYKKRAGEVSLSMLAQSVLGKPLDKSCQCSDWGRRPLSDVQLVYAAMDALSAVLIFRGMAQQHHPFSSRQGLLRHAFTYDVQQGAAGKQGSGADGSGHRGCGGCGPGGGGGAASAGDGSSSAAGGSAAAGGDNGPSDGGRQSSSNGGSESVGGSRHVATARGSDALHALQWGPFLGNTRSGVDKVGPAPPFWSATHRLPMGAARAAPACSTMPCWRWRIPLLRCMLPCRIIVRLPITCLL